MNREEITSALSPIFHRVFNNNEIIITDDLNAEKVDQWDSLTHLNMIAEVEKHFEIKFKLEKDNTDKNKTIRVARVIPQPSKMAHMYDAALHL